MATFSVLRRVDAFVDYVALVEADDAKEAARKASEDERPYQWARDGIAEFDARLFVTLDDEGNEVEGTEFGDF